MAASKCYNRQVPLALTTRDAAQRHHLWGTQGLSSEIQAHAGVLPRTRIRDAHCWKGNAALSNMAREHYYLFLTIFSLL